MFNKNHFGFAAERATTYRENVNATSPYPDLGADQLRQLFNTGLPAQGRPGLDVLAQLAAAAEKGLVGSSGDSFYGWVMGASDPIGIAADWLTSAWGQNAAIYQTAPSAAIAEEVAGAWLLDLLRLPKESSFAFTSGATMASFICLAAARSEIYHRRGWDLENDGIFGAPEIRVFVSSEAHSSIYAALRYLGFGANRLIAIAADQQGAMIVEDLAAQMSKYAGPSIVIAQAGHINTGTFDNFNAICDLAHAHNSWVHIDGAFGLWANASVQRRHLGAGSERADSWAVDGHKWLQIPYDSGFGFVRDNRAHRRAMSMTAGYLNEAAEDGRNPTHFVPELSRRARGFTVWAVLQHLGRAGISDIVDGNCDNAGRLAAHLQKIPGVNILHDVVLNQISLTIEDQDGQSQTQAVCDKLQAHSIYFVKEADWCGTKIIRLSFSSTTKTDRQIDEFASYFSAICRTVLGHKSPSSSVALSA